MTEVKVNSTLIKTVSVLEQIIGPRRYWLHDRVGSSEWEVQVIGGDIVVKVDDAQMLSFLLLKLK